MFNYYKELWLLITARRQLKGQNVSISEELTKLNFQLSEKLQEHNLFDEV
jgi:hypothetical protein